MAYTNRFGRTSYPMRAFARYLHENGPSSISDTANYATLENGRLVKDSHFSMSVRQLTTIFRMHPDFKIVDRSKKVREWVVKEDSELLESMDRSKAQRKDETTFMGKVRQ